MSHAHPILDRADLYVFDNQVRKSDTTAIVGVFSGHWAAVAAAIRASEPDFRSLGGEATGDLAEEACMHARLATGSGEGVMKKGEIQEITGKLCGALTELGFEYHIESDNRSNRKSQYIFVRRPIPPFPIGRLGCGAPPAAGARSISSSAVPPDKG